MPQTPVPKGLTEALRRAMGFGGEVMDYLTPEMSPGASNEFLPESIQSVQDWFQQEPEPGGFRDIASTIGDYASMAGLDPGSTTGAAKFFGGLPGTRTAVAKGLQQVRKTPVGSPVRQGTVRTARRGVKLSEEIPQKTKDWLKREQKAGRIAKEMEVGASYNPMEPGFAGGGLNLPPGAKPGTAPHELVHAATRGVPAKDLQAAEKLVKGGAKVHPRAAYGQTPFQQLDESLAYTMQDLVEGKTDDIMQMDHALRQKLFEFMGFGK